MFQYISKKLLFLSIIGLSVYGQKSSNDLSQLNVRSFKPLAVEENQFPMVFFSDLEKIKNQEPSTEISDEIVHFIDASPKDAELHIAIYLFNYVPIREALIKANNRGVIVNLLIDYSERSDNTSTIRELKKRSRDIEIIKVKNDASSIAINHNKFILFSKVATATDTLRNIVFQTSQNFHKSSIKKIQEATVLWETSYTIIIKTIGMK